jgi:hypothetical protein
VIQAVAASPVGEHVVAGTSAGEVGVWDASSGRRLHTLRSAGAPVADLAVSRDGAHVAVVDQGSALTVYPLLGGAARVLAARVADEYGSCAVAFAPSGALARSCGARVTVWDPALTTQAAAFEHETSLHGVAYADDDALLLLASDALWRWAPGAEPRRLMDVPVGAEVSFSPGGDVAIVTDDAISVVARGGARHDHEHGDEEAPAVAFTPRGALIWSHSNGDLTRWVPGAGAPVGLERDGFRVRSRRLVATPSGAFAGLEDLGVRFYTPAGKNIDFTREDAPRVDSLSVDPSSQRVMWARGRFVTVFDLAQVDVIRTPFERSGFERVALAPGGALAARWREFGTYIERWDVGTGARSGTHYLPFTDSIVGAAFAPSGALWVATPERVLAYSEGASEPHDVFDPRPLGEVTITSMRATYAGRPVVTFSDGSAAALGPGGEVTRRWAPGALEPEPIEVAGVRITPGASTLTLERGGERAELFTSGDAWAMWTPDGLFAASNEPSELLHGVQGGRIVDLDQLALEHNRPDLVFARLGLGTPRLHGVLRARWELRLRRAGLTPGDLASPAPRPEVTIEKLHQVEGSPGTLEVAFEARAVSGLRSVQVSVNGVGEFPGEGAPASGERLIRAVPVRLSAGANLIEVTAFDARGREALRARRQVHHGWSGDAEPTLYFMGFGVSDYASEAIMDLSWAHQDALDLAAAFGKMDREGSSRQARVVARAWTDAEVTPAALDEASALLEQSGPDDVVVLFVAGHGTYTRGDDPAYYFMTHATDPGDLERTGIPFDRLEGLLDGIGARRKLFLMDTCQSGELDVGAGERARGFSSSPLASAAPVGPQHQRYVWRDIRRRTGAIVISSSRGDEPSIESDAMRNGAFTEAVLEAITDPLADEPETPDSGYGNYLFTVESLRATLATRVPELTGDRQHPVVDRDNVHMTIELPQVTPVTE